MRFSSSRLDRVFNPRSVAVIGDKKANGYMWLKSVRTFKGPVYSVQIDPNELPGIKDLGFPNFSSVKDIPDEIDYVIVAVPRMAVLRVLADCVQKQVGGVGIFTSGFAEANFPNGKELQAELVKIAENAGMPVIGPNCMGIFNPAVGLRHNVEQYADGGGPVGFISQSGTHAGYFSLVGVINGIKISKSVSFGNGAVLESSDFLEYLAQDKTTKIIGMYIEGARDSQRLFNILKATVPQKPVVIWKGGQTSEGFRATASHTGSLAHSMDIWKTAVKQAGAIEADNLDETVDNIIVVQSAKPLTGDRIALVAMTGGQSVVIADAFAKLGLKVPLLKDDSYRKLSSFFNTIGGSYLNPFDVAWNMASVESMVKILDVINDDENIDAVVLELSMPLMARRWTNNPKHLEDLTRALVSFKERSPKSFIVILMPGYKEAMALDVRSVLVNAGLPTFPSFERGARALRKAINYYRFLKAQ